MGRLRTRWLWLGLLVMLALSPLGLLAEGAAWGEWAPDEVGEMVGFVPAGLEALSSLWQAPLPDYAPRGLPDVAGYVLSALLGGGAVLAATWLLGRWLSRDAAGD
ncbi:MAG: PDGLE domain-containing protein [Chloroflexota bacterium]